MFKILFDSVDWLVDLLHAVLKIRRDGLDAGTEKALHEFPQKIRAVSRNNAGPVFHLDENSFEVLADRDAAQFDAEVSQFKSKQHDR